MEKSSRLALYYNDIIKYHYRIDCTEDLLKALRRYIAAANKTAKHNRVHHTNTLNEVQHHVLASWQAPDWATTKVWDAQMGSVVMTGTTKSELRNQRVAAGNRQEDYVLRVATELGLLVNGHPHPYIGNIASPTHTDHPAIWAAWLKHFSRQ
jgi:hypothetical protein